ncbi:cadherin-like domain-containing protein [Pseudomonas stutzeri]|nr:cadherin-like domain-containing protein [Stutzerimonas stutzeri]
MTFTPDADFNGVATFSYTVTDGNLVSNTATVTVNVAPVNDAPLANDDSLPATEDNDAKTLAADELVTLTATKTDKDGDSAQATLNIGQNLVFKDDGPSLAFGNLVGTGTTSSLTVTASFWATGASFTGATLTVTVAVLETRLPSVTV